MRFFAPPETTKFVVHGREYEPDADGTITTDDPSHQQVLKVLGCKTEEEHAVEQIKADPPVPEDMVDPEVVKALINENEILKRQHTDLFNEHADVVEKHGLLEAAHEELKKLAAELHAELSALKAAPAPETASEDTQDAPEAPVVPDFAAMSYTDRKAWLADNGVAVPGNISADLALEACNKRYAELNA